jgi:hypothetical protein
LGGGGGGKFGGHAGWRVREVRSWQQNENPYMTRHDLLRQKYVCRLLCKIAGNSINNFNLKKKVHNFC